MTATIIAGKLIVFLLLAVGMYFFIKGVWCNRSFRDFISERKI